MPQPAKRENVRFYPSVAAAQAGGFRACMRCHPERSPGPPPWSSLSPVVSRAARLIADGALDADGVQHLAARLGMTDRHLRRLFESELCASPVAIAKAHRTHFARRLIDETDLPFSEIAHAAGFRSIRQFNHDVRAAFGRPPTELRRRGPRTPPRDEATLQMRLWYRPPLDWPRMVRYLQGRATEGIEVAEHDRYRRTIEVDGVPGAIELSAVAHEPCLVLRAWLPSRRGMITIVERARRLFDLTADPMTIGERLARDPRLARAVRARPGLRVPQAWDPFELGVRAVLGQRISVRAASSLAGKLVRAFGKPVEGIDLPGLTHLFPAPATLADAALEEIGMTRAQAGAIRALATAVADGSLTLDAARGLDEAVERLRALPGVGAWTAHYIAMRALGEPDAFPAGDLGLQRAAGVATARELERTAETWRPWRAYAAMYLWNMPTRMKETR